ncbi:uncharacterized protein PG998_011504 [Apiospora kogelbergensis]|uniref:uncharacterized protein n=1 Tax=Apiospora kogelbergensis TaxID=1337665 RepID=UPI00312DEA1C
MQLKQWAPALVSLLLGVSTAFPSDFAYVRTGDLLSTRAEGDDIRCTPKTPLNRRAIDRPQPGQIDKWVSDNWDKAKEFALGPGLGERWEADQVMPNDPEYLGAVTKLETSGTRAKISDFRKDAWMIRIPGLMGCTVVVVADSQRAWLSHHWDSSFKDYMSLKGNSQLFDQEVLKSMDDLSCKFDKKKDSQTQAIIYTRANTPDKFGKQPAFFGDAIEEMRDAISQNILGLNKNDVKVVAYVPRAAGSSDKSKAVGKLVLSYSPAASAGKSGFELWAGGYKNDKGDNIEGADVKEPIMKAEWAKK